MNVVEGSLPNAQDAHPYDSADAYTVTVLGGTDFQIDVKRWRGSKTFPQSNNAGTTELP